MPEQSETRPPVLRVTGLYKRFQRSGGQLVNAVDGVSIDVHAGEVVVLLGPSGCGKTTLLRSVAGLEKPDAGHIAINGKVVYDSNAGVVVPTARRGLSMIFQSYALWPHMTAFNNIAYPLRSRGTPKKTIAPRVHEVLELVGIPELRNQFPAQMSGGQQQRVALARALVSNDELILFDEPLSNVDARVREQLRFELAEMQARLRFAAVYVTHDQSEALSLAHRIAVMGRGSVQQLGTPREVYGSPTSRYVASFVGTTNEFHGKIESSAESGTVLVQTEIGPVEATPIRSIDDGAQAILTCRPESCLIDLERPSGPNVFAGSIETSMYLGSHTEYVVSIETVRLKVWWSSTVELLPGQAVWLSLPPDAVRAIPADTNQ